MNPYVLKTYSADVIPTISKAMIPTYSGILYKDKLPFILDNIIKTNWIKKLNDMEELNAVKNEEACYVIGK